MKLTRIQRIFILLTALWLPLQAVAGMTMQFCRHAPQDGQSAAAVAVEEHCPYHDAAPAAQPQAQDTGCDSCGICHLASSGYMPPSAVTAAVAPARHEFRTRLVASFPSHIPEPPQYPPKHSA